MKSIGLIELNPRDLINIEAGAAVCPGYWNCFLPIKIPTCIPIRSK
jgi:hypothetical protein